MEILLSHRPPVAMADRVICMISNIEDMLDDRGNTIDTVKPEFETFTGEKLYPEWHHEYEEGRASVELEYIAVSYPDTPIWMKVVLSR